MLGAFQNINIEFSKYKTPKPGMLLIASPTLKDRNFKKSVILICDVAIEGTFGFMLNRSLQMSLADAMSQVSGWDSQLYLGGPVQSNSLNFIHNQYDNIEGSRIIDGDLAWGGRFEDLEEQITKRNVCNVTYKFFVGYAGWTNGQLESELIDKLWFICDMKKDLIFAGEDIDIWNKAITGLGEKYNLLLKYPEDPNLN